MSNYDEAASHFWPCLPLHGEHEGVWHPPVVAYDPWELPKLLKAIDKEITVTVVWTGDDVALTSKEATGCLGIKFESFLDWLRSRKLIGWYDVKGQTVFYGRDLAAFVRTFKGTSQDTQGH